MNATQLPFLVEGILILVAMTFGIFLQRTGKPYGKVKLVFHLFFFAWFTVGYAFILYSFSAAGKSVIMWIPVAAMGLMILSQLVVGILMLTVKQRAKAFPVIHLISAILLLVSDICAFIIAGSLS